MNIKKLHFFDKNGYNLNFDFNEERGCWEGNIYLPPVSLGLYSNTTIFVLEEVKVPLKHGTYEKHWKETETETIYVFPRKGNKTDPNIIFQWDILNDYVDEFFMFTFDENNIASRQSSLTYNYNDGPECEKLIVTKFETYEVELDDTDINEKYCKRVLPIHVAFSSPTQYDGNTYKRTLVMRYGTQEVARITFFAESIEEDERLKVWNYNLGYNITPDDTIIFKESDIEEPQPNYILLNEKRKELLIEGHNIYPYVGSYKALLGAIKFFGYDNINIVEFWKNINYKDKNNYGTFVMSPKYLLSNREVTFVKTQPIEFPNEYYRKADKLAFTYTINTPTGDVDLYELPYVKEDFTFSMGEILIKLFALRTKLNKEFLPSTVKIIDIIGEGSYFGIQLLKNGVNFSFFDEKRNPIQLSIGCYPNNIINITEDRFFNDYVLESKNENKNVDIDGVTILNNINDKTLDDFYKQTLYDDKSNINKLNITEAEKSDLYKNYHKALTYTFLKTEDVMDNDTYKLQESIPDNIHSKNDEDYVTELSENISAKIILTNETYERKTWNELPYPFKYIGKTWNSIDTLDDFQYDWENDVYGDLNVDRDVYAKWEVTFSSDQIDEGYYDNERQEYLDMLKKRYEESKKWDLIMCDFNHRYDDEQTKENHDHSTHKQGNLILENVIKDVEKKIRTTTSEKIYLVDEQDIDDQRRNFKAIKYGKLSDMNKVLFELPFVGYYDVKFTTYKHTISRSTTHNSVCPCCGCMICSCTKEQKYEHIGKYSPYVVENSKEFKKYIKVIPKEIDIRGFYYDARPLPDNKNVYKNLDTNVSSLEELEEFVLKTLRYLTYLAKNDDAKLKYKKKTPGGYDMQMVLNKHMNKINEELHLYDINNGPYAKENFKFGDYIIQDGEFIIDNINKDIVNLIPNLKYARYINSGIQVKPYTWIYLTFDYSKIVHRSNPIWILTNNTTGKQVTYDGKYFTCLLREPGDYSIELSLMDEFGNKYHTYRDLIIVDSNADYKYYTSFKKDYENFIKHNRYIQGIKTEEEERLTNHYYDTGEYAFEWNELKHYDYESFIESLNRDKSYHNMSEKHPEHTIDELTGRLTINAGKGLGWGFDVTYNYSGYDYMLIPLEKDLPENDDLSLYIVDNLGNYTETKLTTKDSMIDIQSMSSIIDLENISYVIFFNKNTDINNRIEIKLTEEITLGFYD